MGAISKFADGLINALSGTGTGRDVRAASTYVSRPLTQQEIAAAYSGSGLMRKICQIPALDMVREWRDWKMEAAEITAIEAAEKRHGIQQKVKQAEVLRAMGGGAIILGLPGNPSEPAPPAARNSLSFVHVVSRWHLTFDALQDNATLAGYGEPVMWKLQTTGTQQTIHPSRVIPFRADTSAALAEPATWSSSDAFWGESTVQQVLDAVTDSDSARASFAALLHKARLLRIGIPKLMQTVSTATGEANVQRRMAAVALAESIHNATIFDAGDPETGKGGETITDATYSFSGAKDVLNFYAEFVAAISDIPATRLLGRAPEGLNSSGDSQQKDWDKKVRAKQTLELSPCLDRLDAYLVPSAIDRIPDGAWYEWTPLALPTEAEEATRFKTFMEAAEKLQNMGVIPDIAMAKTMQATLSNEGWLAGLDGALAEISEDERYGIQSEGGDPFLAGGDGPIGSDPSRRANTLNDGGGTLSTIPFDARRRTKAQRIAGRSKAKGFDQAQPRDRFGRWVPSGTRSYIDDAVQIGSPVSVLKIGKLSETARGKITSRGGQVRGDAIALEASRVRHSMLRHGLERGGQVSITATDIASAGGYLNRASQFRSVKPSKQGVPRFIALTEISNERIYSIYETRKNAIVLVTMWKRRG